MCGAVSVCGAVSDEARPVQRSAVCVFPSGAGAVPPGGAAGAPGACPRAARSGGGSSETSELPVTSPTPPAAARSYSSPPNGMSRGSRAPAASQPRRCHLLPGPARTWPRRSETARKTFTALLERRRPRDLSFHVSSH